MQNGKIRSYSQDKRYGFIHGDDGKSYFFHLNDVAEPGSGVAAHKFVVFDNKPTPKGMAAIKVTVKDPVDEARAAGFNAVLDVSRDQDSYSGPFDGNYKYTILFYRCPGFGQTGAYQYGRGRGCCIKRAEGCRYHSDGGGYVYAALFGLVLAIFFFGVFLIGNTA